MKKSTLLKTLTEIQTNLSNYYNSKDISYKVCYDCKQLHSGPCSLKFDILKLEIIIEDLKTMKELL